MKNKIIRAVVSILLVCILIFNITPIRAEASALPEVAGVVTKVIPFNPGAAAAAGGAALGVQVFAWVCAGLGVIITADQLIKMAKQYQEFSGDLEIGLYYYPDGSWSYGVDMNFVQRVHAFLWKTGIVVKNTELELDAVAYPPAEAIATAKQAAFSALVYYRYNGSSLFYHLAYSNDEPILVSCPYGDNMGISIKVKSSSSSIYLWHNSTNEFYKCSSNLAVSGNKYYVVESVQHFGQMIHPDVKITIEGAELGTVADPGALDNDESWQNSPYREWHDNRQSALSPQTGDKVEVLPIPLIPNGTVELPDGVTQPDVWNGSQVEMLPDMQPTPDGSLAQTPWEGFKKWISEGWDKIINAIPSAETIAQSIGNVIWELFVPSPDAIAQKVGEMRDMFPFIDGIISTGEAIRDGLSYDIAPPEIWIDLGEATTDTFGHKKYLITDFSWYAPYKPRVDALLSAALWAFFSWRVFVRLPSIIGGEGGQIESYASHMHALDMKNAEPEEKKRRGKK